MISTEGISISSIGIRRHSTPVRLVFLHKIYHRADTSIEERVQPSPGLIRSLCTRIRPGQEFSRITQYDRSKGTSAMSNLSRSGVWRLCELRPWM